MKLRLTEKQIKSLISNQISEADAAPASSPTPTSSSSGGAGGGTGYPEVGHWESGASRGPGNQLGKTKWSDVVGSILKRGKGNQLK
jgi:hypothetical protein